MILAFATSAAAPGARRKQAAPVNPTPTMQSATVPTGGTTILLDFTVAVSVGAGGNGGWTVSLSGGACTLTYASGAGTDILTYNLSRTITSSETGTISYTQPGNGIEATTGGNDVATLSASAVTNNSTATAPTLSSATVPTGGTTISLVFSASVTIGGGGNGGVTVNLSGGAATLSYASGSGSTTLVYNISRTVNSGETGTISYTQPGNGIESTTGTMDVVTFSGSSVTNSSTQTAPTPTRTSSSINTAGTTLTDLYSHSVTVGAGGNGGKTITMSGGAVTASYSSGSGSTSIVYSLSRTVNAGETGTTSYTQPGNGLEATSGGNDVASYSGTAVTNNSTAGTVVLPIQGGDPGDPGATGWEHTGVTLTAYSGSYTITGQANLVIDSKSLTSRLKLVNCTNFSITRSKIAASGATSPDGQGNIQLEGTSWGLIEDVEITNGTTGQYDRNIATYSRNGSAARPLTINRVWAHGGFRGMDITTDQYITISNSYMGPSLFVGTGERSHTSAVRCAGGTDQITFNNVVLHVGPDSNGSGIFATYPENGANTNITINGGLWILEDQGGGAPYGMACGYTVGSEPQNTNFTVINLYVSTQDYTDGCPGGVGQHWNSGGTTNGSIGALGGTKVWTNVRKYHPGFGDHNQAIAPD